MTEKKLFQIDIKKLSKNVKKLIRLNGFPILTDRIDHLIGLLDGEFFSVYVYSIFNRRIDVIFLLNFVIVRENFPSASNKFTNDTVKMCRVTSTKNWNDV